MMTQRENNEIALIHEGSILSVLSILILRYQQTNGSLPEIVYLNKNCQTAMVLELMRTQHLPAEAAVLEPVWLHGFGKDVPMLYSSELGDTFVRLINSKLGAVVDL